VIVSRGEEGNEFAEDMTKSSPQHRRSPLHCGVVGQRVDGKESGTFEIF
jgi:hypothetical protein